MNQPRGLFAALILIVAITGVAEADGRMIVPVVGSAAGVNGANFRTEMQLHNPGSGVMRGSLMFLPQSLVPQQAGGVAALEYEIGPKETIRFADVIASMGASGLGSLDVLPFEGGRPRIVVRAFDDQGNFGTRGLMVPVLEESEAPVLGFRFVLVAPSDLARYRFNIGVRTLGESSTMLRIVEHDAAGASVGDPIVLELLGETFRQQPAGMLLGREVVAGHTYAFETLSGAAFVYATTVDNQTNDGALQLDRPVNRPPVVAGATVTTDVNEPVTIAIQATDPDDDPMTFRITAGPSHGTLSDLPNVKTSAEADVSVVYTPATDYRGPDMFTVLVSDDVNGRTFANIVINVGTQAGAAPTAVNDRYTMDEGTTLTISAPGVLANDTDPEGNALVAQLVRGPVSAATFTLNADGSFTYRPRTGFSGGDFFQYEASDGASVSNVARAVIIVNSLNDPPTAVADAAATTEDAAIAINVLTNDSDPNGDPLTVVSVNTAGTLGAVTLGAGGVVNYDPTGSAVLQALAAAATRTDTFTYTIRDSSGETSTATVTVTVTGVDDLPTAVADAATLLEDAAATAIAVLANDVDVEGDAFTILSVTQGANGTVVITGGGTGLTYQPNANACGADSFTYTITGGSTATVTVTVTCVNDAPSFTAGANPTVLEDSGASDAAWATAISRGPSPTEDGQTLTFNVTGNTNAALFSVAPAINATTGNLSFTPAPNANGTADITVTLSDNGGVLNGGVDTSAPQIVTITVTAVNDEPSFIKGGDETVVEGSGAQTVNLWATALSKGPADESGQTLTFTLTNDNNALFTVQPAIDAAGNLTYTLATEASGATTVTVSLADDGGVLNGGDDTAPDQTFTITVTDINDAPSFTAGADPTVLEDSGAYDAAWATAISKGPTPFEDGQTLTFNVTGNTNAALFSVAPAINATTGNLSFTPAPNANGTADITVTLSDDGGTANGGVDTFGPVTFTINVTAQNDDPTAVDDAATVDEDSGATAVGVLANDDDAPDTGETLTITNVQNPSTFGGTVLITGGGTGLTYQPAGNFAGTDTFTYTIGDGNGGTATATVTMTVTALNDAPVNTVPGAQTVDQLVTLTFSSGNSNLISVFDLEAGSVQVTLGVDSGIVTLSGVTGLTFNSGANGSASMTFTGTQADVNAALSGLVYDPADTFEGAATLTITTSDLGQTGVGGTLQDVDTVTINVTALNDPPVNSLPAAQATPEDTTLTLSTANTNLISISDPDAGGATVQVTLTATNGTMTLNGVVGLSFGCGGCSGDGTADVTMTFQGTIAAINAALDGLQFIPTAGFAGAASIQIVTDDLGNTGAGGAQSDTDTLDIAVNAVNNAPVNTVPGAQTIDEDVTLTLTGATAISVADDAGTNPIRFTLTVTQGTLSLAMTTGLTPVAGADGSATMTFDATLTDINNALDGLDYNPAANYFGSDTLTITTNDLGNTGSGGPLSDTDTVAITINSVNDAPSDIALSSSAIDENQASGTAVGNLTTTDVDVADTHTYSLVAGTGDTDNASFQVVAGQLQTAAVLDFETQASYSVRIRTTDSGTGNLTYEEAFTITLNNVNETPTDIALSNASVQENQASGTEVGNFTTTDPDTGDTFSYTLVAGTGSADNGSFQIVGGQLQTAAIFDFETKSSYSIRVRTTDAGGLFFEKQFTISITNQNETPTDITLTDQSIDENSGVNAEVGTFSTTDPDAGDTFTYTLVAGVGSTDNALFNISGNALRENASFDFEAQPSYSIRVRTTDAGGLFVEEALTITIVNVPEAPIAGDDAFDTIGNTLLEVDAASSEPQPKVYFSGTLLTGDVDPDTGTNAGLTTALLAATPGAVVTVNSDGTFTYLPPAGHAGATDTFTYTLSDGALSDTGLVTITLLDRVWYVDPNGAVGGDGRSTLPFNTLNSLDGAGGAGDSDLTGDYIFVHDGTLALLAPMEMEANQHLVGEGFGLSIPVNPNGTGSPWVGLAAGTQPQLTNATGNAVTITTAIPVEIVGLSLASTTGNAIDMTSAAALSGSATLTIASNAFRGAGAEGIDINMNAGTTGTLAVIVTNNSWNVAGTHAGNAIDINRAAGTLRLNLGSNANILSTGGTGINVTGGAVASAIITGFAGNSIHGNTAGTGVNISNVTFDGQPDTPGFQQCPGGTLMIGVSGNPVGGAGLQMTTVAGSLGFTDLDVYAGNGRGIFLSGTGQFTGSSGIQLVVLNSAGSLVHATNGAAVDVNGATLNGVLSNITTSGGVNGVSLVNAGGLFVIQSGSTIASTSGTAFHVSGLNANVTYNGTITNAAGRAVVVSGTNGGTKAFGGAITDTGTGIELATNPGTTINFTGGISLTTGANAAFNATGGGTVNVCDESPCNAAATGTLVNTLTTTTGTALNVNGVTIGANNLEFRSISAGTGAGSAGNGIVLDTTGSSGGLRIAGTGSAGSGGTIQHKTGADLSTTAGIGVYLNNTTNVSLSWMQLNDFDNFAIYGSGVSNLSMANVVINGTNGTSAAGEGEGSVYFGSVSKNGVTGSASVTNCTISGGRANNFGVHNIAGSLNRLTITNSTFGLTQNFANSNDSLAVQARNAGTVANVTVTGCTFSGSTGDIADFTGQTATSMDVVFQNNTITNGHAQNIIGGGGLTFATQGTMTFNASNNTMSGADGSAITLFKASAGTLLSGTLNGNTIGQNGVANSGSKSGNGIFIVGAGGGALTLAIGNNIIQNYSGNAGIYADNTGGTYDVNVTITGNTVRQPGPLAFAGLALAAGAPASGDDIDVCATIGGAGALQNDFSTGDPTNANDIIIGVSGAASSIRLPGYGGAASDVAAITTFIKGNNANSASTAVIVYDDIGGTITGGAACSTP